MWRFKLNAEQLIQSAKELADKMYADAHPADRLSFEIGLLHSRIRELCYIYQNTADELRNTQRQIRHLED
jgi:hypothetical protein